MIVGSIRNLESMCPSTHKLKDVSIIVVMNKRKDAQIQGLGITKKNWKAETEPQ